MHHAAKSFRLKVSAIIVYARPIGITIGYETLKYLLDENGRVVAEDVVQCIDSGVLGILFQSSSGLLATMKLRQQELLNQLCWAAMSKHIPKHFKHIPSTLPCLLASLACSRCGPTDPGHEPLACPASYCENDKVHAISY